MQPSRQDEQNNHYLNFIQRQNKTHGLTHGQYKIKCPECQLNRTKNKQDSPFSVNIDHEKIIYNCFHCGINGIISRVQVVQGIKMQTPPIVERKVISINENVKEGECIDWLEKRKIDPEIAIKSGCILNIKNNKPVIGFSFMSDDKVDAIKWRSANGTKTFWWENNAQRLWGEQVRDSALPDVESTIVITEGEMDTLAIKQAFFGHSNIEVYSCPNGAPSKVSDKKVDPKDDVKYSYIWNDREKFENVERIILATDSDSAGDALADELSRRLNKARCYRMEYAGHKDANELLMLEGEKAVRDAVLFSPPIPLHGLNTIDHYSEELQSLYDNGKPQGVSTGMASVDKLFTIKTGMLNIITGYPSEGKSCFLDQLIINLGRNHGYKTCYCSFENPPSLHAIKLSQILMNKPFFEGHNERMSQEDFDYAQTWISDHILFQDYQDGGLATIESVLEKAQASVMRNGCRILVIDPFNFIHTESKGRLETDVVSDILSQCQLFAKQTSCVVFFVAHPSKPMDRTKKHIVGGLDVSKSMAWFSKADLGITIHRGDKAVEVHVWKTRWGIFGHRLGKAKLSFDPVTGRYGEAEEIIDDDFDWSID